ncbi:UDP-glucuronosyltransferase 3A1 [Bombina bombina]|uniref:UDP-glucuronosyltransferase 3A1 n=1 Tax=Bombina bombina TaxID=8345 RepID=UPI00235B1993|nr:UDP-glucuronosyltransferase 3A1 [Bombina bombina]
MTMGKRPFIFLFFMQQLLMLQGAKILTLCLLGGSHYLLMDEVSRILHNNSHEVTMFRQLGEGLLPGYHWRPIPYKIVTYFLDESYLQEFDEFFKEYSKLFFNGKSSLNDYITFMGQLSKQCNATLNQTDILDSLKADKYDIAVIDALNPCTFLVVEKLGVPYIAFFPGTFANGEHIGLPTPLSYVPIFQSSLTDHMDFFERVKNIFMYFGSHFVERKVQAQFEDVIKKHFPYESRPFLSDLYLKAELWLYNTDFSLDFARPLLPHIQYIGGLLAKPTKPVSQELEEFISQSGESGFIVVTLGSMISSYPNYEILKEMNSGFAKLPQKVIWRYQTSQWPKGLKLASNVKIMDWVSQNDLLGHPNVRLLVTHGGWNSLMEAVYHGVPVVGIPLFGDQFDNLARMKAKKMGTIITPDQIKAERFANVIQQITEDKSYKTSAMHLSVIHRSRPFPPDQQLVRWVEHIIQTGGGAHLRPYSFKQPWYQQCLLDVILFISSCLIVTIYIIVKLFKFLIRIFCSSRKQKQH